MRPKRQPAGSRARTDPGCLVTPSLLAYCPIKLYCEILVELRAIARNPGANVVEDPDWQAFRVGRSLQHDWWNSGNQNRRRNPLASVATNVARHFAAPVECPMRVAFLRSSASMTAARSSAYPSISFPVDG